MPDSLNGWALLRSMMPPWGDRLKNPLLHYEVRVHRRAGRRSRIYLFIAVVLTLGVLINLALASIFSVRTATSRVLAEETVFILMVGLGGMSMLGHWRLLLTILGRSSAAIAQRRERGDWDLIYITPVSKTEWFRAQLTALGWQVFPLVQRLMIVHFVLIVIAFPTLLVLHHEQYTRVSGLLYAAELLTFAVLILIEPIFTAGIFTTSALLESSMRRRAWVAFLSGFTMVYATRVVIALALQIGGFIILMILSVILEDNSFDWLNDEAVFFLCVYCIIGTLVFAFVLEWVPPIAAILMMSAYNTEENLYAYSWLILTLILAYIITPPILIRILTERTIKRLHRPER